MQPELGLQRGDFPGGPRVPAPGGRRTSRFAWRSRHSTSGAEPCGQYNRQNTAGSPREEETMRVIRITALWAGVATAAALFAMPALAQDNTAKAAPKEPPKDYLQRSLEIYE